MKSIAAPLILAFCMAGVFIACNPNAPKKAKPQAEAETATPTFSQNQTPPDTYKGPPKQAAPTKGEGGEVVFDPKNPPPGFRLCHRNHCHRTEGGVVSYTQVMEEIGATKMVGMENAPKMPPAPSDVAAPPADAQKTASGLAFKILSPGKGTVKPKADSVVTVHYTGWTTDGKAFDSSLTKGRPIQIPLNRVIKGWTEGIQLMTEGEERRFWIPENLAYMGMKGKPQGMLVFDVVLMKVGN